MREKKSSDDDDNDDPMPEKLEHDFVIKFYNMAKEREKKGSLNGVRLKSHLSGSSANSVHGCSSQLHAYTIDTRVERVTETKNGKTLESLENTTLWPIQRLILRAHIERVARKCCTTFFSVVSFVLRVRFIPQLSVIQSDFLEFILASLSLCHYFSLLYYAAVARYPRVKIQIETKSSVGQRKRECHSARADRIRCELLHALWDSSRAEFSL